MVFINKHVGKSVSRVDAGKLSFPCFCVGIPNSVHGFRFSVGRIFGRGEKVIIVAYLVIVV